MSGDNANILPYLEQLQYDPPFACGKGAMGDWRWAKGNGQWAKGNRKTEIGSC
jgi:hypothetical protein